MSSIIPNITLIAITLIAPAINATDPNQNRFSVPLIKLVITQPPITPTVVAIQFVLDPNGPAFNFGQNQANNGNSNNNEFTLRRTNAESFFHRFNPN